MTFAKTKSLSKNKFKATWGVTMSKHRIKCKRRNPCQNFKSVAGHYSEKKLHDMSILCPKNWRQDGGLTCMSTNPCEWPFDRRMLMTFNVRLDLTFASTTALKRNVWWDVVIFMYFLRRNMRKLRWNFAFTETISWMAPENGIRWALHYTEVKCNEIWQIWAEWV